MGEIVYRVWEGLRGAFLFDFDTKFAALEYIAGNPAGLRLGDHYEVGTLVRGDEEWVEVAFEVVDV